MHITDPEDKAFFDPYDIMNMWKVEAQRSELAYGIEFEFYRHFPDLLPRRDREVYWATEAHRDAVWATVKAEKQKIIEWNAQHAKGGEPKPEAPA